MDTKIEKPVVSKKVKTTKPVENETLIVESTEKQIKVKDEKNPRLLKIIKDPKFEFRGLKIGDIVKSETFSMNKYLKSGVLVGKIVEFHTFPNKHANSTAVKIKDELGNVCYRVVSRLLNDSEIINSKSFDEKLNQQIQKDFSKIK